MGAILIDERRAPLIVVTYPHAVTIGDYREVFERYEALARRSKQLAWLIDFRHFNPVFAPSSVRRAAADVFEQYRAVLAPVTVGEARVVPNVVTRGIVTAFDWLTPNKWPTANVSSMAEAEAFLAERLGSASADHRSP